MSVGAIDLAILLAYMAGVVFVGMWVGRVTRTAADFMVGGRDLPWWVILFSIVATETSTVTFLSIPGFAYGRDLTWLQIVFGFVVGRFIVAFLLLPQYFQGNLFTAYEVLDKRFGGATKRTASVIFIVTRTLADGLRLFLSAIVLQEMTGIPMHWAVVTIGVATIVYTYLGGMRAVLWTDFVQFVVYMEGRCSLSGSCWTTCRVAGADDEHGRAAGKLRVFDFTLDLSEPYVFWAGLIGGMFVTLGAHGVDQMMVQRYLAAATCGRAARSDYQRLRRPGAIRAVSADRRGALLLLSALSARGRLRAADRVFARFILDEMPVGVLGILLGAIFAAAMSTLSSSLNSSATAAVNDLYCPLVGSEITPARKLRVIRILTAWFGLVQIVVGIAGHGSSPPLSRACWASPPSPPGSFWGCSFWDLHRAGRSARGPGWSRRGSSRHVAHLLRHTPGLALVRPGRLAGDLRCRPGDELHLASRNAVG